MSDLLERSYWSRNGKYEDMAIKLGEMIPREGPADPPLELFRCATNIYYDCYNNGGCNLYVRSDELSTLLRFAYADSRKRFGRIASILYSHRARLEADNEPDWDDDGDEDGYSIYLEDGWMQPLEKLMDAVILATERAIKSVAAT